MRKQIALLIILAVAAIVGWLTHEPRAAAPPEFFGVNAGRLFEGPPATWLRPLRVMQAGGIRVVRSDASWAQGEPAPPDSDGTHTYRWEHSDAVVAALAAQGIRWYPIIDYSAPWAASQVGNFRSPPASTDNYAAYARALAARYGTQGEFWRSHRGLRRLPVEEWEIWNEENGAYFWAPAADPQRYADLYIAARAAIKGVDERATVVLGGLLPNEDLDAYLATVFERRHGAEGHIDAVGFHPYAPTAGDSIKSIQRLRSILTALGHRSVPIDVTEVGWTTRGNGRLSEAARTVNYSRFPRALLRAGLGVGHILPYAWVTREAFNQADDWFGLFHPDTTATPAGRSYLTAIDEAR